MTKKKSLRGFASMSPERHAEIARLGGKAAQALGKAHRWTPQEASIAGKKGGIAERRKRMSLKKYEVK